MGKDLDGLFLVPGIRQGDEEERVVSLVRQWADREIIGKRLDYLQDYSTLFLEKFKMISLSMGLQRLVLPEDLGGFGWNTPIHAPDTLRVITEIGRADASAAVLLAMHYAIFTSLFTHAPSGKADLGRDLEQHYLSDELKLSACILPGPGYVNEITPLFKGRSLHARIDSPNGNPIITGKGLRPLAAGSLSNLFCIVCAGGNGLQSIALVPEDAKGITRSSPIMTTGLNACANAEISLDKVSIPVENIIDSPGSVENLFIQINLLFGGASLGAGLNFFEILSDWCETRVIKGSGLLKENPLCASVLADVAEELACTKLLLLDLAHLMADPRNSGGAGLYTYAGMIGARAQQSVIRAINRGLELMGSAGYAKEWHAEKHWRDVKTIQSILCGVAADAPVKMDTARFFYNCSAI